MSAIPTWTSVMLAHNKIQRANTTLNKKNSKGINRILDGIQKIILMVLPSTPRKDLYIERGVLNVEAMIKSFCNRRGLKA